MRDYIFKGKIKPNDHLGDDYRGNDINLIMLTFEIIYRSFTLLR